MYANFSCFYIRPRKLGSRTALWICVAAFVAMSGPAPFASERQTNQVVKLSVHDPRPVAKALELLEARYGWIITYEDPRYVYEDDVIDQTAPALGNFGRRALIPRGGPIDIKYIVSSQTGKPDDPAALIQMVLDAHAANGNPGIFRLVQTGQVFHVVPAQVKNSEGRWVEQGSLLDTPIILPERGRTVMEMVGEIGKAVAQATGTNLIMGTVPASLFFNTPTKLSAANEAAQDVLVRAFDATGRNLSWRLLCDPGARTCALNVHLLPDVPSAETANAVPSSITNQAPAELADPSGDRFRRRPPRPH